MDELPAVVVPILFTTAGAIVMKLADSFIGRPARRNDDAARIRGELRADLSDLRLQVATVRESEGRWREAHYASMAEVANLRVQVEACHGRTAELQAANLVLVARVTALELQIRPHD